MNVIKNWLAQTIDVVSEIFNRKDICTHKQTKWVINSGRCLPVDKIYPSFGYSRFMILFKALETAIRERYEGEIDFDVFEVMALFKGLVRLAETDEKQKFLLDRFKQYFDESRLFLDNELLIDQAYTFLIELHKEIYMEETWKGYTSTNL